MPRVDFEKLTAALLAGQAKEAEIKVCLALAHHDGSPISERSLGEIAHISYSSAQVGVRLGVANGRLRKVELLTVEEAKRTSHPRWKIEITDTYLHLDSVQVPITGSTVQAPLKSFIRPEPKFGAPPGSTGLPAPTFGAGPGGNGASPAGARGFGTSPEELIKPEEEESQSPPVVAPAKSRRETYEPEFELLWKAYGRPNDKWRAYAAWQKLTPEERGAALAAAEAMAAAREVRFRPYLHRFLAGPWRDWPEAGRLETAAARGSPENRAALAQVDAFIAQLDVLDAELEAETEDEDGNAAETGTGGMGPSVGGRVEAAARDVPELEARRRRV